VYTFYLLTGVNIYITIFRQYSINGWSVIVSSKWHWSISGGHVATKRVLKQCVTFISSVMSSRLWLFVCCRRKVPIDCLKKLWRPLEAVLWCWLYISMKTYWKRHNAESLCVETC